MSLLSTAKPLFISALLLAALGTLPACVNSTDYNRLNSQVYMHEQERKKQEERIAMLEEELMRTKQDLTQPMQSAQANSWAEINSLRSQVATLTGQVEDMQRGQQVRGADNSTITLEGLHTQIQDIERKNLFMASQLGIVFDEIPSAPAPEPGPLVYPPVSPTQQQAHAPSIDAPAPDTQPTSPEPSIGSGGGSQELYQKALEGFYAKKYKQAQATWAEFVKGFPKDPLVPNALFWQGECYFQLQDYANAVLAYQKVIEDHPQSNKYQSSLLKQGISFFKLKKDQAGKLVLEDLIKKHPQSPEAKRAQTFLQGNK